MLWFMSELLFSLGQSAALLSVYNTCVSCFVCSSPGARGCFHSWLLSDAGVIMVAQMSKSLLSDLLDRYLETELLGYMVTLCLTVPQ